MPSSSPTTFLDGIKSTAILKMVYIPETLKLVLMKQSETTEEKRRLHELYSLNALQTQPDTVLDTFCEKVAKLFDVPSCVVSLVLEDRQWFKSSFGCPVELAQTRETPRDISFCTHVVDSRQPLIVKEVSKDPRFKNNPLVQKYGFGFYAGFPLTTGKGHVLGSLCLYDNKPREFSKREVELLGLFSQRVMAHLELCRELEHVRASEAKFRSIAESAHDGLVVIGEDERIIEVNPAMEAMFGWSREELLGQPVEVIMPERYRKRHHESIARFIELGASDKFNRSRQFEALRRDGTEFPIEISISGFSVGGSWTFTAFIRDVTERKRAEEDLQRNTAEVLDWKNRYEAAIQASGQVLYDWNPQTNDVTYGGNVGKILGYSTQELNGSVNHWIDLIHPDDRNLFNAEIERNLSTKEPAHLEYRIRKKNGDYITVEDTGYFCFDGKGNPTRMVGFVVDTTERKRTEEAARKRAEQVIHYQNALLQLAKIDNSDMDLALKRITEIDAKTLGVERVSIWRYNEDRSEIVCENLYKLSESIHEKGFRLQAKKYPKYFQAMKESRTIAANDACTDPCTSEFSEGYLKPLGITSMMDVPIWLHGKVVGVACHEHIGPMRAWTLEEQDFGASIADMVSLTLEASERKRAEEALAEQAVRDALTNLYNRRYFNHRIREELKRADRHQQTLAILLCDLDHFKTINDTQGHQSGDEVLKAVAKSIQESTRGTDLVFRWGGDEIVVILSEVNREGILIVAERIRSGVHKISDQAGIELDVSIGVALYPEHGRGVDGLIRLADRALYIAKKGGDKVHIGIEEYHLDEHTIKVVFQPIVNVRSNEVISYEALSRDSQGKLSILELFKRYQAIGQLKELKCICFRTQLKAAHKVGLQRVFINVDFNVLNELELVPKPRGMDVILEISELEALHDVENHLKIATKWRESGYKFAIDDFGAGFISLPFIAQLVPEYIKVDRSTILQAVGSQKFMTFSKDLVQAIRNYSSEGIIAEGVETEKELKVVKDIGIHLIQGFLFGKPQELK